MEQMATAVTKLEDIPENQIFEIDPLEVKVKDDLPRQRKDLGEIHKLAESITKFGQLLPVLVNQNKELIAGGRRLAACLMLGRKVRIAYKEAVDNTTMRELELEENIQRKALTPAEECLAIDELVKIKQAKYGKPTQGKKGGFTLEDAASIVGKTKGNVIESIQIAELVKEFPELGNAKTKSEIKKAAKGIERATKYAEAAQRYEAENKRSEQYILLNKDAVEYMKGVGDKTIDLLFTDPPYGIDINNLAMTIGGQTGGEFTTAGVKYEDSWEYARSVLEVIVKESFRIVKDNGHAYIFCGRDRFVFQWLYDEMVKVGWDVLKWPLIWIKRDTGQNNQPERWPSSAYEAILFARKIDSTLQIQGKPDWIQCNIVNPSERLHQAEKPIALCQDLIQRTCLPGAVLLDPCMGSGAIIESAVKSKVKAIGAEKDTVIFGSAVSRMEKVMEDDVPF